MLRRVIDACTDCDCCRYTMDTNCLFFPEIYKPWDREKETGERITAQELRRLADLSNYCALCPCPDIREFAYYSQAYQDFAGGDARNMIIPNKMPSQATPTGQCGMPTPYQATFGGHHMARKTVAMDRASGSVTRKVELRVLDKSIYGKILKDDGYFSSFPSKP